MSRFIETSLLVLALEVMSGIGTTYAYQNMRCARCNRAFSFEEPTCCRGGWSWTLRRGSYIKRTPVRIKRQAPEGVLSVNFWPAGFLMRVSRAWRVA